MTSVVTYANNERQSFCQLKFDTGERVLVSIAGLPKPSIKIMRLAFGGLVPFKTIWEYNAAMADSPSSYVRNIMTMFPPDQHGSIEPLDVIRDTLLRCSSLDEVNRVLQERQASLAKS